MSRSAWLLLVVGILVTARRASADDPKASARKHIEAATALHEHRRWAEALEELNVAYTLDPQPELLYAIAQLHVALGDCPQAITFYGRFIASRPIPSREAVARKAITICKTNPPPPEPGPDGAAEPTPTPEPKPEPTVIVAPAATRQPWYADIAGDVLVGGGITAGVVATWLYSSARSDLQAASSAPSYPDQARLYDQAGTSRTYAVVIGAGGLALVSAGVIAYLVHDRGSEPRASTAVTVTRSGGVGILSLAGRF